MALILKIASNPDEVYILEAVSSGVTLTDWTHKREHIGPDKFYKMVMFRHIEFERKKENINKLKAFL